MKRFFGFLLALAVLSCSQKEIIPSDEEKPLPVLKSITVEQSSLVLSANGSVTVAFTVKDPGFVFKQVILTLPDGTQPEDFSVTRVDATAIQGRYNAIISDRGVSAEYNAIVHITIVRQNPDTGVDSFVSSNAFIVRSEAKSEPWQKTGLPVVYVDTQGGVGINSKTAYVQADVRIDGTGEYPSLQASPCRIRGRGNTTWTWPKKPYLIAFDEQQSVLGMPRHKRWVLLANFMDRTLMRNLVSMKVATLTSLAWTPRCVPVELVLNGVHKGSYLLIEQVRVDKDRVNISKEEGYLLELDFHYDNEFQWKERNIPFAVKYPDPDELTQTQKTYIKNYVKEVSDAIYGTDFKDPEKGYARYLDIDSFIDEWIVYEVMCNHELGNPGSVFFHKDKDGLLKAGPAWDFDWGVLSFYTSNGENGLVNGKAIWYARLFQDPAFKDRVKARFQELLPQLETIPEYMEECRALLSKSAQLNFKMWNPADDRTQNGGRIINGDENLSFDAAVDRLKKNYNTHLQVIQRSL